MDNTKIRLRNLRAQCGRIYRYYAPGKHACRVPALAVFMADGRWYHGGLTDRFKGMLSIYAYAKAIGVEFRINHTFPLQLSDFLQPSRYDWRLRPGELSYNLLKANPIILQAEISGKRLFRLCHDRQHHFYYNYDILPVINRHYNTNFEWAVLFHELFEPTPELEARLDYNARQIGGEYIAVAFRFQQLLNDFKDDGFPVLPELERSRLMDKNLQALRTIHANNPSFRILVTSDSSSFLSYIANESYAYVASGVIAHMQFPSGNEDKETHMKSFVDFFLLSRAKHVYAVKSAEMYPSEFHMYAAIMGGIPFERIFIE